MAAYEKIAGQQADLKKWLEAKSAPVDPYAAVATQTPSNSFGLIPEQGIPGVGNAHGVAGTVSQEAVDALGVNSFGSVNRPLAPDAVGTSAETDTELTANLAPMRAGPMRAAPSQVIPGSFDKVGETRQIAKEIDAAGKANLDMAYDRTAQATRDAALQGQARAVEEAEYHKASADQQEQHAVELQAREHAKQQLVADRMGKLDAVAKDIENGKVDPSHYFREQGTGAKLATMLSVVLGAGGAQRINGRNVGLDMMNDAIARDIDAQKVALQQKRSGFEAQNGLYAQMLQTFGREDAAKTAAHIAILRGYEAKIASVAAKYKGSELGTRAEMTLAEAQKERGKFDIDLGNMAQDSVAEQYALSRPQVVGGVGGGSELDEETFVDEGNGKGYLVGTKEQKQKLQASGASAASLQSILTEAVTIRNKWMAAGPLDKIALYKDLKQLESRAATKATVFEEQGTMSRDDKVNTLGAIGDMTSVAPGSTARIAKASDGFAAVHASRVREAGGRRVDYGYGQIGATKTKPGHEARVYRLTGESTADQRQVASEAVTVQQVGKR